MLEQELIRAAIEKKRDQTMRLYEDISWSYEKSREIGVGILAELIDVGTINEPNPDLTKEIVHDNESLEFQKQSVDQAAYNLQEYERLLTDPCAMQEFFDRHIGNQKEGAK